MIRIVLFALGTWGVILGAPSVALLTLRPHLGTFAATLVGAVLLAIGVFFVEWLAHVMNFLLFRNPDDERE